MTGFCGRNDNGHGMFGVVWCCGGRQDVKNQGIRREYEGFSTENASGDNIDYLVDIIGIRIAKNIDQSR